MPDIVLVRGGAETGSQRNTSFQYFRNFPLTVPVPRQTSVQTRWILERAQPLPAKLDGSSSSAVQRASVETQTSKAWPLLAVAARHS